MESAKDVGKNVEVNEFQDSLNELYENATNGEDVFIKQKHIKGITECRDVLQELVDKTPYYKELEDKATPKKVRREEEYDNGVLYAHYEHCGNCEYTFYELTDTQFKYCPNCGQAIDWSKDE